MAYRIADGVKSYVVRQVLDGKMTVKEAATYARTTERSVRQWVNAFRQAAVMGAHAALGPPPPPPPQPSPAPAAKPPKPVPAPAPAPPKPAPAPEKKPDPKPAPAPRQRLGL